MSLVRQNKSGEIDSVVDNTDMVNFPLGINVILYSKHPMLFNTVISTIFNTKSVRIVLKRTKSKPS